MFLTFGISSAQKLRGFGSIKAFLDFELSGKGFASGGLGLDYKFTQVFRGEIEASLYLGSLVDVENKDENGNFTSLLKRNFTALNFSFCPKIVIGDKKDEPNEAYFQILPSYNITKIEATGSYATPNKLDATKIIVDNDSFKEVRHTLGIGIGVYTNLSDKSSEAIALNLYCNFINFGNSLTNLRFTEAKYSTVATLGLGFNYYFGFVKKSKKK